MNFTVKRILFPVILTEWINLKTYVADAKFASVLGMALGGGLEKDLVHGRLWPLERTR